MNHLHCLKFTVNALQLPFPIKQVHVWLTVDHVERLENPTLHEEVGRTLGGQRLGEQLGKELGPVDCGMARQGQRQRQ